MVLHLGLWILQCYLFLRRADSDYIVCVRIVCFFDFIEIGFLRYAFVFALTIAIILGIDFLILIFCKWKTVVDGSDFYILIYIFLREFVALMFGIIVCFCWLNVYIGLGFPWCAIDLHEVAVSPLGNLLRRDLRRGGGSLKVFLKVFSEALRGRTGIGFLRVCLRLH